MSLVKEFKEFALKGNVVDMAVGVIIGGAFGKIVSSLVNDIIMPPLGLLVGNVDFGDRVLVLKQATDTVKAVTLNYGAFINALVNFLIIAFSIFMAIRFLHRLQRKEPVPPAAPTEKNCPYCLMLIPLAAKKCGHCASTI